MDISKLVEDGARALALQEHSAKGVAQIWDNDLQPERGNYESAARAVLAIALAEDAAGLCERLEKRAAFWERYWTGRSLQDPDSGPIREAAALLRSLSLRVEAEKRAREDAQMELKRHFPVSKYNGLDIEQWKDRCMAAERVLAMAPMRWREKWFGSPPQKGSWIYADRDPVAFIGETEADHAECGKIVLAHNAALEAAEAHSAELAKVLENILDTYRRVYYMPKPGDGKLMWKAIDEARSLLASRRTQIHNKKL